jgi:hypothetical protein
LAFQTKIFFCRAINFSKLKKLVNITNELRLTVLPRSIELKDDVGLVHNVNVQILGTEDTWKTPSLLMVSTDNGGKIIFSQV